MSLLLRNRDFGLLWLGGLVSLGGSWVLFIALPLHMYEETGSPMATAGVLIALVVPGVAFGALGGVAADRYDRRRLLVWTNVALAATTVPLLVIEGGVVWLAYPILFVNAAISQLVPPAENALLPRVVGDADLVQANGLNALNNNLARLGGPVLGGALYAVGGISAVIVADAISFVVAAACIALVRTSGVVVHPDEDVAHAAAGAVRRTLLEARDGLRAIRERRVVTVVFAVAAMAALGEGVMGTMFVVWVKEVLGGGVAEVGWLMSGQAVGGVIGGLTAGQVGRRISAERLFGASLLVFGLLDLALFNFPRVVDAFLVGYAIIALVGIPAALSQASRATLLQRDVPDHLLGRVFGTLGTAGAALMLAGALVAGAIGAAVGPLLLLNIQGGAYAAAGLVTLVVLTQRERGGLSRPVGASIERAG